MDGAPIDLIDEPPSTPSPALVAAANRRWAESGAMALAGRRDGPALLAPSSLTPTLDRAAARLAALSQRLGRRVELDGPALLGERAAITGWARAGRLSIGGTCRIVRTADDWIAVQLARPSDVDDVPAWLELDGDPPDVWATVVEVAARRDAATLVERAALLGLPGARLGEVPDGVTAPAHSLGDAPPLGSLEGCVVVDLSSLWAGPLCSELLAEAGAQVYKVESPQRRDGARRGPAAFFELMNQRKQTRLIDLTTGAGRRELAELLARATVVVSGSRRRAFKRLGLLPEQLVPTGPRVWLSITGHGWSGAGADRVGFGDDAAVAGGLVSWEGTTPLFCADAAADPATGLIGAGLVLDRLASGGRWHIDLALAKVAAHLARNPAGGEWTGPVAAPRRRPLAPAGLGSVNP